MLSGLHYEDIKASIRKKYSSVRGFEQANGLPMGSVHDWSRGRTSARVHLAIEQHLASIISLTSSVSADSSSKPARRVHRLNERAA